MCFRVRGDIPNKVYLGGNRSHGPFIVFYLYKVNVNKNKISSFEKVS